ncbi:hypothetical protein J604_3632 [Acinetobacter sp. 694762]|nr:hypothetical protein J604_3632 [Acinetobacter sp. 694762]
MFIISDGEKGQGKEKYMFIFSSRLIASSKIEVLSCVLSDLRKKFIKDAPS